MEKGNELLKVNGKIFIMVLVEMDTKYIFKAYTLIIADTFPRAKSSKISTFGTFAPGISELIITINPGIGTYLLLCTRWIMTLSLERLCIEG